ncbi:UvrD/REP helicase N-terminal domain [Musa troglodytarum]|nr:UvrD/REP helicase N-terminal domain [Musa troglodytarum]
MEETRAEIHSSLDDISKAPRAKILAIEKGQRKSETTQEYYIDVEFLNNHIDCGSQNYKARNGDLFILSSMKPENVKDFNRYNVACCLALVTEVSMADDVQKGFVVKLPKFTDVEYDMGMNNNIRIINEVLSPKPMMTIDIFLPISLQKLYKLQFMQQDAEIHRVELVWGPPGTGKTKTLIKYTDEKDKLHGLPSSLGDVLLFGNSERMEIDDELQDVFLDYRVERLVDCFAPSTGWKYRISSVISLLEDCSFIDEAAQLKECESVIPLRLNRLNNVILVGDECQLPSTVKSQVSKDAGFGVSLFERLSSVGQRKHLLNMQYRMHPSISLFPNFRFYKKQILDGPNVVGINYNKNYKDLKFGAYAFLNVADGREEVDEHGNSKRNMVEVVVVLHLVQRLFIYWEASGQILSIGVISPYSSQVNAIKEKLGNKYGAYDGFRIRVKSIDGFQGEEDDVIILSTVRSSDKANIGFLQDHQRTNVALTRARHCLWIVGNAKTLEGSGTIWKYLVLDAKARKCYFNANDDVCLAKSILHVKHELDQLDDLLRSDSVLLSSSRWKVLFSDDFKKSFLRLRQLHAKQEVIHLLLRLSNDCKTCLDHIFSTHTEVYLKHCKPACVEGNLEVPMSWNVVCDMIRYKTLKKARSTTEEDAVQFDSLSHMEDSKVNESLLLMKFYSLSSRVVRHWLIANDGTDVAIPFELNDQEKEIICFPLSTFILGRSGTGKTTILTMKLIQKEQLYSIASEGASENFGLSDAADRSVVLKKHSSLNEGHFLKQVFLTVSSKLCSAIRSHICQLQSIASGCDFCGPAISLEMNDKSELSDLLDIPDSFTGLKQEHYPLVITFRKFLMMLDGTFNSFFDKYYNKWGVTPNQRGCAKSFALQSLIQSKEVNYEKFVGSYWPLFNKQLTKTVNASTVFTQIISHIKGGLDSGTVHAGKLKREDYLLLSEKRVSTLSRETRETIYDIFIDYENNKLQYGEFDLSDFVNDLHQQLACNGFAGDMIDFVYIDEVQDLTLRQIGLLRYVCKNFEEGYTFAGDTAQTIARGIDFRFEDIRSLFYTEFLSEVNSGYQQKKKEREIHVTDMFQLNQNFRTHAGILGLAQSVMDLLYYFFPLSVDKLIPEVSLICGEAPVLLESSNDENAILTIFGNSGSGQRCLSGFGAEQVILVRDTVTKEQIFDQIGKQALVLTILECKGLEFQDVLLYNFFGTSPLKKKWRVTYEYMKHRDILEPSVSRTFPSFELERCNLLCSELKQLYVAITRTKQRLWICENTDEYSKPMFDYWKRLCLVQERHLDSSLAQAMKVASSAEDWRLRGIELFNEGNFDLAAVCFEKAGDEYNEKWAKAAGLVAHADLIISTNTDMGMIYMEKCGISGLKDAADCFAMAECWTDAAHAYAKGKFLSECLSVCSKGRIFETGLEIIEQWNEASCTDGRQKHELNEMISSYLENCAQHYLELGDIQRMMMFVKAFQSNDVRLRFLDVVHHFLKSNNLIDDLLTVELELGNYIEAASIARNKGNMLLEAEILEKANCFEEATSLLLLHVLMSSLWSSGNKGWPLKRYAERRTI